MSAPQTPDPQTTEHQTDREHRPDRGLSADPPMRPRGRGSQSRGSRDGHVSGGHGHGGHSHAHGPAPRASRRVRVVLAAFLVPALLLTIVGLVLLWPHGAPERGVIDTTADTAGKVYGTVVGPAEGALVPVELDGTGEQVQAMFPPEYVAAGIDVGSTIKMLRIPQAATSGSEYVFMDFTRDVPIGLLAVVYVLVVLAVARWRGLAALGGLVVAFGVIVVFTLPALLLGTHAIGVALVTSACVMFVVLYLAHGFTARTSAALLGTFFGLVLTALLAGWAVDAANIFGLADEYALVLPAYAPDVDMRGIAVCGIVLAGLGVLNDVTITQASAVWELRAVSPTMNRRELFSRGMRIGRDHIASTVYTIAFAYLGAALPMLLMVSLINMSLGETLTSGEIAQEVVRTLVGSIGLVLAIPATTLVAALAVGSHASLAPATDAGPPVTDGGGTQDAARSAEPAAPPTGAPAPGAPVLGTPEAQAEAWGSDALRSPTTSS